MGEALKGEKNERVAGEGASMRGTHVRHRSIKCTLEILQEAEWWKRVGCRDRERGVRSGVCGYRGSVE